MATLRFEASPPPGYSPATADTPLTTLQTSKLNIFIGSNNSGKSRLLRYLWKDWAGAYAAGSSETQSKIRKQLAGIRAHIHRPMLAAIGDQSTLRFPDELSFKEDSFAPVRAWLKNVKDNPEKFVGGPEAFGRDVARIRGEANELLVLLREYEPQNLPRMVYVPILRGLRPVLAAGKDGHYEQRTRRDYGIPVDNKTNWRVFTGETMYSDVRRMLLGDHGERDQIRSYENFLADKIFQKPVTLIPKEKHDNDVLHIKIGEEDERPIYDLGDGLQTIVILTFPAFQTPGTWLFVEEPEHCLHPGMQRKLLESFRQLPSSPTIFATTHSNHLIDMVAEDFECQIYRIKKIPSRSRPHVVSLLPPDSRDHLQDLGVRISSVMLTNSTVWVEGFSDRWFFRHGLRAYQDHLGNEARNIAEDTHYSLVEYAGNNITHYSWLDGDEDNPMNVDRLCAPAMLVADADDPAEGSKKANRIEKLSAALANRFITTHPAREIENLIPPNVLKATVDRLAKVETDPVEASDYETVPIGKFIEEQMLSGKESPGKGMKAFSDKSGALASKRKFWTAAEHFFETAAWSDYSETAQKIITKIYDQIVEDNWPEDEG